MAAVERGREVGEANGSRETSEKAGPVVQIRNDGRYGLGWRLRKYERKINRTR